MARVAFVEAWFKGSHRAWAESVRDHSRHDVELCTLPGVHWEWRLHGGPLAVADQLEQLGPVDAVVLTSAVDASAVLGLARRSVGDMPIVVFMHENQLTFPLRPEVERRDLTPAMANWRSVVAADAVVWNSAFHRDDFLAAAAAMLRAFPDHRRIELVEQVADRSTIVHPGVDAAVFDVASTRSAHGADDVPVVLWNHRWEWDRDPDRFVRAVTALADEGVSFRLAVVGPNLPEQVADQLAPVRDRVVHAGSCDRDDYLAWLARADIVVSTTRHEFYGMAVAEAMAAGAIPVVPDGLAYLELVPAAAHEHCLYRSDDELVEIMTQLCSDAMYRRDVSEMLAEDLAIPFRTTAVERLDAIFDRLVSHPNG